MSHPKGHRFSQERDWKSLPSIGLNIGQKRKPGDQLVTLKGKLKQKLSGEKRERRESQFEPGLTMACPGVKIRRKTGPSGSKHYKTWLRKGES